MIWRESTCSYDCVGQGIYHVWNDRGWITGYLVIRFMLKLESGQTALFSFILLQPESFIRQRIIFGYQLGGV